MSRPLRRKSPYRHPVKDHMRKGLPVGKYERGKGNKPRSNPRRSRVVGGSVGGVEEYDITLFYVDAHRETFSLNAKNYVGALASGIETRDKPLPPKIIRMRLRR